jgi:hypothetical protein
VSDKQAITIDEWTTAVTAMAKLGGWFIADLNGTREQGASHVLIRNGMLVIIFARLQVSVGKTMAQHIRPMEEWAHFVEENNTAFLCLTTPAESSLLWACLVEEGDLVELEKQNR